MEMETVAKVLPIAVVLFLKRQSNNQQGPSKWDDSRPDLKHLNIWILEEDCHVRPYIGKAFY